MTPPARLTFHLARPRASFPEAHELDFGLQVDIEPPPHLGLDLFDETSYVDGGGAAFVDDEISMQRRDDGLALSQSFQSRCLAEPAGGIAMRVFENAAAVLGLDGLRLVAVLGQLGHHPLGLFPIPTLELDRRTDDERALQRAITQR